MQENPRKESSAMAIPDHVIERIARCLLPRMLAYFESEEGQRELASENRRIAVKVPDVAPCNA